MGLEVCSPTLLGGGRAGAGGPAPPALRLLTTPHSAPAGSSYLGSAQPRAPLNCAPLEETKSLPSKGFSKASRKPPTVKLRNWARREPNGFPTCTCPSAPRRTAAQVPSQSLTPTAAPAAHTSGWVLLRGDCLYCFDVCMIPRAHSRRFGRAPGLSLNPKARGLLGPPPSSDQHSRPLRREHGGSARLSFPPLTVPGYWRSSPAAQNLGTRSQLQE